MLFRKQGCVVWLNTDTTLMPMYVGKGMVGRLCYVYKRSLAILRMFEIV